MLQSIENLQKQVSGPLLDCFGPSARVLTVESYEKEVRGLALCPGKVVKYIYQVQTGQFMTFELLSIKKKILK
tara:strand:- start:474 stop:692 length:219 start_codon:yes stop_codon:yes gene_type:complete